MIKNLVFDVGEVLLSYRWIDALMEAGAETKEEAEKVLSILFEDPFWHNRFDKGEADGEALTAYFSENYPDCGELIRRFMEHPETMPVPRPDVYAYLPKLKEKGYGLYIISDYSSAFTDIHFGTGGFRRFFDGEIVSYKVKMVKPDLRMFGLLCETYHLKPEECVFLDDKPENIEGCRKAGMEGIQITSEDQLIQVLQSFMEA